MEPAVLCFFFLFLSETLIFQLHPQRGQRAAWLMEVGDYLEIYPHARPECYVSKSSQQKGSSQPTLTVNGSFSDNEVQDMAGSCFEVSGDSSF